MCWSHSAAVLMLFLMTKTLTNLHFCKKNPTRGAILPVHEGILACRDGLHGVTCLSSFRRIGASPWGLDATGKKGGKWTYPSAEELSHGRVYLVQDPNPQRGTFLNAILCTLSFVLSSDFTEKNLLPKERSWLYSWILIHILLLSVIVQLYHTHSFIVHMFTQDLFCTSLHC